MFASGTCIFQVFPFETTVRVAAGGVEQSTLMMVPLRKLDGV